MLKKYLPAVIAALAIVLGYFWLPSLCAGEEGRIRKCILKGRCAIEQKDILTCAQLISRGYHDEYGNTRESALYAGKEFFAYYKSIAIVIEKMDVLVSKSQASAKVEVVATILCRTKNNTKEKIFEGEKGRFRIELGKEENRWLLKEVVFLENVTLMGQNIS